MVLMIVSGRSGSGKSVALRALEDMGFYCVDNLPVELLPNLARSLADRGTSAAVSIDVRNMPESPEVLETAMDSLPDSFSPQLLFLDADRNTLIRRYSDTRLCTLSRLKICRSKAPLMKRVICWSHYAHAPILLLIRPKCRYMNWLKCCVHACLANVSVN